MMQPLFRNRCLCVVLIVLTGMLAVATFVDSASAASAESKFYAAERCALHLHKNPRLQKYRDRWLQCINKYLAVYRHDPHGPWAAAGMFHAGELYGELYGHSYLEDDRREALELLDNVAKHYPKSKYRPRALAASQKLSGKEIQVSEPAPSVAQPVQRAGNTDAKQFYDKAQANDKRLKQNVAYQKYRDRWMKSIDLYRKAYLADPDGEFAAASLYGMAESYNGLYKWSRQSLDQLQAQKALEDLVQNFPQSSYAADARRQLNLPQPSAEGSGDAIADVIQGAGPVVSVPGNDNQETISQQATIVEGLRFWSNPRYTRVVVDANRDTVFTYHELREDPSIGKPQRIYIDVHNSRLSRDLQKVVPINDNLLSDARAGQYTKEKVRVVVDIKSSKTFKIFSLKNPFRIVLDVWGEEADDLPTTPAYQPDVAVADPPSTKMPQSAIVKQLALGVRRIVIDPGHGGKDYGAPGYLKGVHEKHIVLQIGNRLAGMIRKQLNCEVLMTRSTDTYLSLEERTAIANTQNADLFISIHTNASPDKRAHGLETFILNLATDDEAIRVAARENATSTKNISDLDSILQDLMQNAKVSESTRLASYVQQSMLTNLKKKYGTVRNKGVKKAPFYVLLGAQMPSILVETAFISNPRECQRLKTAAYQEQLCQGIVDGIKRYIEDTNPMALKDRAGSKEKG